MSPRLLMRRLFDDLVSCYHQIDQTQAVRRGAANIVNAGLAGSSTVQALREAPKLAFESRLLIDNLG